MPVVRALAWAIYAFLALLSALLLSWRLCSAFDFAYPLWYQVLDIEQHIAEYAPQNRYRQHFQLTTEAERERLFSALVTAIHQDAQNLEKLNYHNPLGRPLGQFLTSAEIIHLQDVAKLLNNLLLLGWLSLAAWCAATLYLRYRHIVLPGLTKLLLSIVLTISALGLIILLIGPVKVFYHLHEWIFPSDHQWFFYYQDSLMTTLLKAPDVFAPITLILLIGSLLLLFMLLIIARYLTRTTLPKITTAKVKS